MDRKVVYVLAFALGLASSVFVSSWEWHEGYFIYHIWFMPVAEFLNRFGGGLSLGLLVYTSLQLKRLQHGGKSA